MYNYSTIQIEVTVKSVPICHSYKSPRLVMIEEQCRFSRTISDIDWGLRIGIFRHISRRGYRGRHRMCWSHSDDMCYLRAGFQCRDIHCGSESLGQCCTGLVKQCNSRYCSPTRNHNTGSYTIQWHL